MMSAISSNKEYFLDKLTTLDEDIQETYFNYIEKYIKTDDSPRISVEKDLILGKRATKKRVSREELH